MDKKLEIRRKIVHFLLGAVLVGLINYDLLDEIILGGIVLFAFIVFFLCKFVKVPIMDWVLDNFERKDIRNVFPGKGPLFYLIGAEISLLLFSKDIAMASILILAIGDSIPNIVGMYFSNVKHPFSDKKFLEGAVAGMVFATIGAMLFVAWYEALVASVIAIFVEGIDMMKGLEKVDDNLIVPLVSGGVIWLFRILL